MEIHPASQTSGLSTDLSTDVSTDLSTSLSTDLSAAEIQENWDLWGALWLLENPRFLWENRRQFRKIAQSLCYGTTLKPLSLDLWYTLSVHPDVWVRLLVAQNPRIPADVLPILLPILLRDTDTDVRHHAMQQHSVM